MPLSHQICLDPDLFHNQRSAIFALQLYVNGTTRVCMSSLPTVVTMSFSCVFEFFFLKIDFLFSPNIALFHYKDIPQYVSLPVK